MPLNGQEHCRPKTKEGIGVYNERRGVVTTITEILSLLLSRGADIDDKDPRDPSLWDDCPASCFELAAIEKATQIAWLRRCALRTALTLTWLEKIVSVVSCERHEPSMVVRLGWRSRPGTAASARNRGDPEQRDGGILVRSTGRTGSKRFVPLTI